MASLNVVHIIGNLTRDVELKYTPKGTAIADVGLAVNRNYTTESGEKREEVTFIDVTFWGKTAEIVGQYCKKGNPLYVGGRLTLDSWDDKQTGQKRSKLKVIGDNIQLLGGKRDGEPAEHRDTPPANRTPPPQKRPPVDPDLDGGDDGKIPF